MQIIIMQYSDSIYVRVRTCKFGYMARLGDDGIFHKPKLYA